MASIIEHDREECWDCDQPVPEYKFWKFLWTRHMLRGRIETHLARVCEACCVAELALLDADAEGRRHSKLMPTDRCACGRRIHASIEQMCVYCWRENRMLDKKMVELRNVARLANKLYREARSGH